MAMGQVQKPLSKELSGLPIHSSPLELFVVACEPSGDLLGSLLLKECFSFYEGLSASGVCGPLMRKLPIHNIMDAEHLSVMGFIDVARSFLKLSKAFFQVKKTILELNPKVLLLIDAPSFNLKLALSLKKAGYRGTIIQYVCPTIWAWKKHRKKKMLEAYDILVPLFPFEVDLFKESSLKTYFFGHPLTETLSSVSKRESPDYITLFPGSRKSVIEKNLPIQLETGRALSKQYQIPLQIVAASESASRQISFLTDSSISIIPYADRIAAMENTRLALATSGTVTLELALCSVPTIVNYVIRPLDEWLATKIFGISLPFYCIVNLLLNKELFPEYYGSRLVPSQYHLQAQEIHMSNPNQEEIFKGCASLKELLSQKSPHFSFAKLILSLTTPQDIFTL
jgi:lipid-A-disaccharide synthase